jgi:polyisoprenoid-binding protein YceI
MNPATNIKPRSRLKFLLSAALLSASLGASVIASNQTYGVAKSPNSSVEFNFRVTLIPVPGTINSLKADLNFDAKDLSKTNGTITVNLAKLETGIGLRDEHARGYIGAEKHPNAAFNLARIEGLKKLEVGKETKGIAIGSFDLNGIKTPLNAPITLRFDGNRVVVSTAFNVTLKDHQISIPGADDKVDVKVNFALEPKF